ncbi:hypothetical protein CEXT_307791, partial [Caerostris extrusa]
MKGERISGTSTVARSANEPNLLSAFLGCLSNSELYRK